MSFRVPLVAIVGVAAVAIPLTVVPAAQQPQQPFTAANRTVAVYATVTNAQGRLVPDLKREDFVVEDNGKPQQLTLFSNDIQPITIVMLLDRSGSMKPNFELEERAAEEFVRSLAVEDKARIGSFANKVQIDPEEFTSERESMLKILRNDLQADGPTPLWNAVNAGIDDLLLEQGRRVVLVFTDGVDAPAPDFSGRSHNHSLKDVMKRAEEQNVMIYAIGQAGENGMPGGGMPSPLAGFGARGGGGGAGRLQMEQPDEGLPKIAAATGGGYFELMSPMNLGNTFARVANELHHQYALGFTPEKLDGKMHDITVKMSRSEFKARARKRYLASK